MNGLQTMWSNSEKKEAPKVMLASYALAAIQFFRPQAKSHLVWSWKLVKTWNQVELPTRAAPFSAELVLCMAGQAFQWQQFRIGWLLILGFFSFSQDL